MPLVLELGRRWVDEVVHPSTIAERPQVAISDGHTASLVVGVSATPRRRELRVRLRGGLKGHRDRWSAPRSALSRAAPSRPGPLRPPARRPWHRRLPFPRAGRPVGGCFGYAFGIEDQQVAQAGRDTTLSSGPGHSRRTSSIRWSATGPFIARISASRSVRASRRSWRRTASLT